MTNHKQVVSFTVEVTAHVYATRASTGSEPSWYEYQVDDVDMIHIEGISVDNLPKDLLTKIEDMAAEAALNEGDWTK